MTGSLPQKVTLADQVKIELLSHQNIHKISEDHVDYALEIAIGMYIDLGIDTSVPLKDVLTIYPAAAALFKCFRLALDAYNPENEELDLEDIAVNWAWEQKRLNNGIKV